MKINSPFRSIRSILAFLCLTLCGPHPSARAAVTAIWTGAGSDNGWVSASGSNWSTTTPGATSGIANTDTAVFNLSGANTVTVDAYRDLAALTFDSTVGSFTLSGGNLYLAANSTSQLTAAVTSSGQTETINTPITLEGPYTFANNALTTDLLNIAGPVTNGATATITLTGVNAGNNIISGAISDGAGATKTGITKSGAGTWLLTGANTYTGPTAVSAGILQLSGANGAGTGAGTYTLSGGTLVIDNTTAAGGNNNNRMADLSLIALAGGNLLYKGADAASTNSAETTGTINGTGGSTLTITYGSTNTSTLTAANFTHNAGNATDLVNGLNLGKDSASNSSVSRIIVTTAPTLSGSVAALATGINAAAQNTKIVPFLVGEATSTTGGLGTATGKANTLLTYNATTGLRPLNPTDEFVNNSITTGTNNTYITAATTAASTASINSLVINGGDVSINDGATLADTSGALLFASNNSIKQTASRRCMMEHLSLISPRRALPPVTSSAKPPLKSVPQPSRSRAPQALATARPWAPRISACQGQV